MAIKRFSKGDLVRLRASDWNKLAELAESAPPPQPAPFGGSSALVLRVRNNAGRTVPRGGVLGLGAMTFTELSMQDSSRVVEGYAPTEQDHFWRFAIAKEPIRPGETGICLVQGVALVRVFIRSPAHWYAAPINGTVEGLASCQDGQAQILVKENEASLGPQWCWVRLSNTGGILFKLTNCDNPQLVIYSSSDLASFVGQIVRLKGQKTCWLVELVDCGDDRCKDPVCVNVVGVHNHCAECRDCWRLEDCDNPGTYIYTDEDLSFYDGRVVKLVGQPDKCWKVSREKQNCTNLQQVQVEEDFDQCSDCFCWKLVNCYDSSQEIWTTSNLARQLGKPTDQVIGTPVLLVERPSCWKIVDKGIQYCSAQAEQVNIRGVLEECACPCIIAVRCDDPSIKQLINYATNAAGAPIDLTNYIGQTVRDSNGFCWTLNEITNPDQCSQYAQGGLVILEAFDDCQACQNLVKLKKCGTTTEIVTYSDLTPWGQVAVGNVYVRDDGTCWEVTQVGGISWTGNEVEFIAVGTKSVCSDCSQNYKLVVDCYDPDCQDPSKLPRDLIVSDPRLAPAVGAYIKIDGFCYKVSTTTQNATDTLGDFKGPFSSCSDCLGAPIDAEFQELVTVCKDPSTGNLRFVVRKVKYVNGLPVCVGHEACLDPANCTNECDTGSGGGGGSSTISCNNCDVPSTLTVTFSTGGSINPCSCMDGVTLQVTYNASSGYWEGSKAGVCSGTLVVRVFCVAGQNQMKVVWDCDGEVDSNFEQTLCDILDCQPFSAQTSTALTADNACCNKTDYAISITE